MLKFFRKNIELILACAIIVLGLTLRIIFIGKNDLWCDEAFILAASGYYNFPEILPMVLNPPLYYSFIGIWVKIFGVSEASLRLPSALFSFGAMFAVYFLAKRMFNAKTAIYALIIIAFNPFHLWYAQEAVTYAMTMFLATSSSYFYYRYFVDGKNRNTYIYFVLFSTLSILSNPFAIVLFASQLIFTILASDIKAQKKLLAFIPALLCLPFANHFLRSTSLVMKGFWLGVPTPVSLLITLENFILGYNGTKMLYLIADIITAILSLIISTSLARSREKAKGVSFCLCLGVLPILLIYIISRHVLPIYLDRAMLVFTPYFYILIGVSIAIIRHRALRILIIAILVSILSLGIWRYYSDQIYEPDNTLHHMGTYAKKPFKPMARFLVLNNSPDTIYVITHTAPLFPLLYYSQSPPEVVFSKSFFCYDPNALDTSTHMPFQQWSNLIKSPNLLPINTIISMAKRNNRRIILIGSTWLRDGKLDENSQNVKNSFDKNFKKDRELIIDGVKICIYES